MSEVPLYYRTTSATKPGRTCDPACCLLITVPCARIYPQIGWVILLDRLRVVGGEPPEQKIVQGHLPRVIYHRAYFRIRRRVTHVPRVNSNPVTRPMTVPRNRVYPWIGWVTLISE
jgi:hypothetical protein